MSQTPVLPNHHRQTSTHRPLAPQTSVHSSSSTAANERPLIVLYRRKARRPLIVLYRRRRGVDSSSSTAAKQASTHRPLPPQTRRPLIVLYRRKRDVHSLSSTAADEMSTHRRPLPPQTSVHSSSSTAANKASTHRPLPPQTRCPLIVLYRRKRDVHSSSSTAAEEMSTHRPLPPQTRRPLIVLYRRKRDIHSSSSTAANETSTHRPLKPCVKQTQTNKHSNDPPGNICSTITSTLKAPLEDKRLTFQKSRWYGDDLCPTAWDYDSAWIFFVHNWAGCGPTPMLFGTKCKTRHRV
ncbi:hypothetical protein HF521_017032 [Silurus meridionalis]|uniref:Uncharacterized protein n=1 Tax=Silurus meridionalis TaxID=175797 RepID=A0A8T0BM44_SILME|nr:hypothetical protein HF521_017032 [Silurus meridionalis]